MKRARSDAEEIEKLRQNLKNLKVVELQNILEAINCPKYGRKVELQDRILNFFKNGVKDMKERQDMKDKIDKIISKDLSNLKVSNEPTMPEKEETVKSKRIKTSAEEKTDKKLVTLKSIPYFEKLGVLLPPSLLTMDVPMATEHVKYFYFILTSEQVAQIEKNRVLKSTSAEYNVQVQLRFCLMDNFVEQKDLFPQGLQVRVNNRICQLPQFLPARPNTIPKRPSQPLNITPFVKIVPMMSNTVEVRWQKEGQKNFVMTSHLVRQLTAEDLVKKLPFKKYDQTKQLIKDKLSKEVDSEIATTMLRVSLNCPLGKTRMILPCRASTCKHLQCFDTMLYLKMNEKKQTWICPVCSQDAIFENLAIDEYFMNVIKSLDKNVTEIQLNHDGSWSKLTEEVKKIDDSDEGFVISDDEDTNNNNNKAVPNFPIFDVKPQKPIHINPCAVGGCVNGKKQKNAASSKLVPSATIDLTLDD